jgi:hypothetical protein
VLAVLACACRPPPTVLSARSNVDRVDAACADILAANRRADDRARAAFRSQQVTGAIPPSWQIGAPWSGSCVRAPGGAWTVVLDAVVYGGVHDVELAVAHVDGTGAIARAADRIRFNYVTFQLAAAPDGGSVTIVYTSEGPEADDDVELGYTWNGATVARSP